VSLIPIFAPLNLSHNWIRDILSHRQPNKWRLLFRSLAISYWLCFNCSLLVEGDSNSLSHYKFHSLWHSVQLITEVQRQTFELGPN